MMESIQCMIFSAAENRRRKRLESPHLIDYQADRRKVKDKYGNKSRTIVGSFEKGRYGNRF
nr:hypothetical protein [Parabacteroides sp. AD58]